MTIQQDIPDWIKKPFNRALKILFWDDEADKEQKGLFKDIEEGIKKRGWYPIITSDKEKAKEIAFNNGADVVVLDLLEDGKPIGVDILKCIREKDPFLPIVMFSIISEMEFVHQSAYRGDISYYLKKPIRNYHEIVRSIEVAVEIEETKKKVVQDRYYASLGELAVGVALFIKNSLWNIGSRAQYLLNKTGKDDEAYGLLEVINRRCEDANKVVVDLLNFARRKSNEPKKKDINIVETIFDVLKLLAHDLKFFNIDVKKDISGENVIMLGDEFELKEAFLNIIKNAVEAMPKGGTLSIQVASTDKTIIIHISDTGEGMSVNIRDKLFMPFYTTKANSVGIGLYVTNRIIRSYGGSIKVESEEGKGSTVTIALPCQY